MRRAWVCLRCGATMRGEVCPRTCDACSHTLVRLESARGTLHELARTLVKERGKAAAEMNQTDLRVRLRAWFRAVPTVGDVQELGFLITGAIRDAEWLERNRPAIAAGE